MSEGKKRARTIVIVFLAFAIPVLMLTLAFCGLGIYIRAYNDRILPNVFIDGVDVSGLTRGEAAQALNLHAYDTRGKHAEVLIVFPDDSELYITGEDVLLKHDAQLLLDAAFSSGHGDGFIRDTILFLQRMYNPNYQNTETGSYAISYGLDMDFLAVHVNRFTEAYNSELESSKPLIFDDKIVMVKGAGQVRASEADVTELALNGLLESFAGSHPVKVSYCLPEANANPAELIAIQQSIYVQPVSAVYDPEIKAVTESFVGVNFDYANALDTLNETESGKTVTFNMVYTDPDVTQEYLESLLFRDVIGECVTHVAGSANRLNNIVLASDSINGIILEPGEQFSFNQIVGNRTAARGYRVAPAFSGGQKVQAIGGGICQVSSTLYSAIRDTDIKVTERHPHGQPISYLPRGRDATVSWGTLDFKFVNNTEYPLRVVIDLDGRTLTARVFGTLPGEEAAETTT